MVFSSLEFLLVFLPITVGMYYLTSYYLKNKTCLYVLILASLVYYGYWNPKNLSIIICSLIFNYSFGKLLSNFIDKKRKALFILGVSVNLAVLAYYKYMDFFIQNLNLMGLGKFQLLNIVLPIGISFFTFQQLAYLSDIYTGKYENKKEDFMTYALFVCFFPQLVAGPIVHHKEMMPQFASNIVREINWENIYKGLLLLSLGLSKKVLIADNLYPLVQYAFDKAQTLTFLEAVISSLSYSLQLYFDFSGYCDMATGIALFFNINLPQNFNSPYKATDIQDFWRRWHITLSRWLRDYLYIPLGGNRDGKVRTLCNLFLTFLLGGLWHGAAWNFVLWGAMHGIGLCIHRIWQKLNIKIPSVLGWIITFLYVNFAWIVFRASNFDCVVKFFNAFSFKFGLLFSPRFFDIALKDHLIGRVLWLVLLIISLHLAVLGKNNFESINKEDNRFLIFITAILFAISICLLCIPDKVQEFIYFQF